MTAEPADGVFGVDHAIDYVTAIEALVAAHPTLTYIKPRGEDGMHIATYDDDEGSHKVEFDHLRHLYHFLRMRFGTR